MPSGWNRETVYEPFTGHLDLAVLRDDSKTGHTGKGIKDKAHGG
ncbi:uncharacterized protein Asalp_23970 [Aeromonas salmonicida subsp. pectinolytica 34mel]|uniref:Uncharacterized protein n=1 Tax=Aeromonas salmonicida subsp. pectinolytica 34mel TaxID=1324960 RepID=A0A2D1QGK0_AERSA|nr:uncharacterized protein Asalp_23970 [Aeromonas salmonicida subsp. pectinolytica 34mel]